MQRLRKALNEAEIPYVALPSPLSRSNVVIGLFGPIDSIKFNKVTENIETPRVLSNGPTSDWCRIEEITMKQVPRKVGVEKILFYTGAKKNFRSTEGKKKRNQKTRNEWWIPSVK